MKREYLILIDNLIILCSTKKRRVSFDVFDRSSITMRDNNDKILLSIEMNDC